MILSEFSVHLVPGCTDVSIDDELWFSCCVYSNEVLERAGHLGSFISMAVGWVTWCNFLGTELFHSITCKLTLWLFTLEPENCYDLKKLMAPQKMLPKGQKDLNLLLSTLSLSFKRLITIVLHFKFAPTFLNVQPDPSNPTKTNSGSWGIQL